MLNKNCLGNESLTITLTDLRYFSMRSRYFSKGGREAPEFTVVRYWRKIISPKVFRQGNSIELDRTLIAKVKMLFTWSHVKGVDYKGWDLV